MRSVKSLVRDEDGQELVEFAMAAVFFFSLIFAVMGSCIAMYAGNFVAYAAEQGARYAMVRGGDWANACATTASYACKANATNVKNYVLSLPHPGLTLTAANVNPTWTGAAASGASAACTADATAQGCLVQVKVTYTFQMNLLLYTANYTFPSTAVETIQD
jgi:Flp pilus assembly protein TadG